MVTKWKGSAPLSNLLRVAAPFPARGETLREDHASEGTRYRLEADRHPYKPNIMNEPATYLSLLPLYF